MTIDEALYTYLQTLSSVTGTFSTRIYPTFAPKSAAFPRATFTLVSNVHEREIKAAAGITQATIQIDVWDDDNAGAAAGAEVLRNALDGYRFLTTKWGGSSGVDVRRVSLVNEQSSSEPPTDGTEVEVFRRRMDFEVWYKESIPTLA